MGIEIREELYEPKIEITTEINDKKKTLTFNARQDIVLTGVVDANPVADTNWFFGEENLFKDPRCKCKEDADGNLKVTIKNASREDSGQYSLISKNKKGETKKSIDIIVFDRPSAPTGPIKFVSRNKDRVT